MSDLPKRLPIGLESFEDIRRGNFYYVDKTGLIQKLLNDWGKINLFTRPRRFGKSLNMDMLKSFFDIGTDFSAFDGLDISEQKELCRAHMGKYPVIAISFKDVNGSDFESAYDALKILISDEARRLCRKFGLLDSGKLLPGEKKHLSDIMDEKFESRAHLTHSLKILSRLLNIHCGKNVILLIDEYDVPLDKAFERGYYEKMVDTIRDLFSSVLKSNECLQFAVLTGCLRIAKESIFSGLNNFVVNSISDVEYAEYFGFTDDEVKKILCCFEREDVYDKIKEWYDGYHFGNVEIYCPWDVVNYLRALQSRKDAEPESYWINSSSNAIIRTLLENATLTTRNQLEQLISGEMVDKKLMPELTYRDFEDKDLNVRESYLWSVMYAAGYLTEAGRFENGQTRLKIPNREIREIYEEKILGWFRENIRSDESVWKQFCHAVRSGNTGQFQEMFNEILRKSISIRDTFTKKEMKENFYHGMLLGILQCDNTWAVMSNQESGIGYSDILLEIPDDGAGCVIEVKYAENGAFDAACKEAIEQVKNNDYAGRLRQEGFDTIYIYGVACYKKSCQIISEQI